MSDPQPPLPLIGAETAIAPPICSSQGLGWRGVLVEQYHHCPNAVDFPALPGHLITINLGDRGELSQTQDGRTESTLMITGGMTLVPAGRSRHWRWDHDVDVLTLLLEPDFLAQTAAAAGVDGDRLALLSRFGAVDWQVQQIGISLLGELRSAGLAGSLYVESLVNLLVVHLLRHHATTAAPAQAVDLSPLRLRQAIDYIHAHLETPLALADLAALAGVSPHHFARLFRQATGLAPHQYVIFQRVKQAEQLLATGSLSIAAVAQQVGFADQSHLNRHFKRILGVTPKTVLPDRKNVPTEGAIVQDQSA